MIGLTQVLHFPNVIILQFTNTPILVGFRCPVRILVLSGYCRMKLLLGELDSR